MSQTEKKMSACRLPGKMLATAGLALCLMSGTAHAAGAGGSTIGYTCMGCHGFEGKGSGSMPRLAGLPAEVIAGKLMSYKSGSLEGTVMNRLARGYTDEEIQAVAEFFAKQ